MSGVGSRRGWCVWQQVMLLWAGGEEEGDASLGWGDEEGDASPKWWRTHLDLPHARSDLLHFSLQCGKGTLRLELSADRRQRGARSLCRFESQELFVEEWQRRCKMPMPLEFHRKKPMAGWLYDCAVISRSQDHRSLPVTSSYEILRLALPSPSVTSRTRGPHLTAPRPSLPWALVT